MNLFENPLVLAKHAAEREVRSAFQARYGSFWKCRRCGAFCGSGKVRSANACSCPIGELREIMRGVYGQSQLGCIWAGYSAPFIETIAAAAILAGDVGWSLPPPARHHDVMDHFIALGFRFDQRMPQGFVTSTGRFVDRREAKRIAVAAGQYRNPDSSQAKSTSEYQYQGDELFSEDVW